MIRTLFIYGADGFAREFADACQQEDVRVKIESANAGEITRGSLTKYTTETVDAAFPSVFLVDGELPDALEIVRWVKAATWANRIVVIYFALRSDAPDVALAYQAGANSVLLKQTDAASLRKIVVGIDRYWLRLNLIDRW